MTLRHAGFVGRMAGAGALLLMVPLGGLVAMAEEPTQNPPLVADLSWPLILLQDAHSSSPILGGVIDFTVCTKRTGPDPDQCTTASDTLEREERTIDSPSDILRRTLPKPDLEAVQTTVNVHVVEAPAGWATPPRAITGVLTRGGWTMNDDTPNDGAFTFRLDAVLEVLPTPTPDPTTPAPTPDLTTPVPTPNPAPSLSPPAPRPSPSAPIRHPLTVVRPVEPPARPAVRPRVPLPEAPVLGTAPSVTPTTQLAPTPAPAAPLPSTSPVPTTWPTPVPDAASGDAAQPAWWQGVLDSPFTPIIGGGLLVGALVLTVAPPGLRPPLR